VVAVGVEFGSVTRLVRMRWKSRRSWRWWKRDEGSGWCEPRRARKPEGLRQGLKAERRRKR